MFFRAIDKFFVQLKYLISIIIFILIAMASLLFVYWLLYSAKIVLPDFVEGFMWAIIDFFAQGVKGSKLYDEITPILPVLASGVFIILTYVCNCLMVFLENNHIRFQNCVQNYKQKLERTINKELHDSFIEDLKKNAYMLVKIKLDIEKQTSYLTANVDSEVDVDYIEKQILSSILSFIPPELIAKKGMSGDSIYFLIADFDKSREFFSILVSKAARCINDFIKPKLKISFFAGAEVFDNLAEFDKKSTYVDKLLSLKVTNKIVASPKFKLLFENLYSDYFLFNVLGEYNLSDNPSRSSYVMMYSLHRKF